MSTIVIVKSQASASINVFAKICIDPKLGVGKQIESRKANRLISWILQSAFEIPEACLDQWRRYII